MSFKFTGEIEIDSVHSGANEDGKVRSSISGSSPANNKEPLVDFDVEGLSIEQVAGVMPGQRYIVTIEPKN